MNYCYKYLFLAPLVMLIGCVSGSHITTEYLNQKYTNDQSEFKLVDGANIHYRDEGEGEVLVLLHGIASSLQTWDGWTRELQNQFRIVRLDLPGFGLTGADTSQTYTMERYINVLHAFLSSLNISEYYIAGNSMGGWLAWEYALKYPDEVKKMILIAAAGFITPDNPPKPLQLAQKHKKIVAKGAPRFAVKKFLKQAYGDKHKVSKLQIDRYYELNHRPGNGEVFYTIVTSKYQPHTSRLPEILVPTLIMWGSEDKQWIDVSQAKLFEELLPNSKLIIYDGLGHLPMEEDPENTAKDAREFLRP